MKRQFDADFFAGNRKSLLRELRSGALIVLTAYSQMQRGHDYGYRLEQEPNFWYLTGITHPDWQVIIDGASNQSWLVSPDMDPMRELFDGALTAEQASEISGIKHVIDHVEAKQLLAKLRREHTIVQTLAPQVIPPYYGFIANPAQRNLMKDLSEFQVQDCRKELSKLRAIKQPEELEAMQAAIDITVAGIKTALKSLRSMKHEYEFEAVLNSEFRRTGGSGHGFDPIIASGLNACTVHYLENNAAWSKDDWLLVDVGAKVSAYSADISRTFPLSSKPSKRSVAVYEAALRVHDRTIELCQPGQNVQEYLSSVEDFMTEELLGLKIINDKSEMRKYFPYSVSHGLGLDVHDSLAAPLEFREGMVLTVEPGIQLPDERLSVRIEDDILITADGPKVMSGKLPTKLADLEKLIG